MPSGDLIDLEPDEEILAVARASFRGAAATSTRATFALGSARMRMRAFKVWQEAAISSGFPMVPPDMVVVATDQRILVGKATFLGRTPTQFWGAVDFGDIAQLAIVKHGIVTGVAIAFRHGSIVEIEALRSRRLRHLVTVIDERLSP